MVLGVCTKFSLPASFPADGEALGLQTSLADPLLCVTFLTLHSDDLRGHLPFLLLATVLRTGTMSVLLKIFSKELGGACLVKL